MYYVYVLKSLKNDRIYIGCTKNVDSRLKYHNGGKVKSTRPYLPYVVIYTESYHTKKEALIRERQIKNSGKLRKEIKDGTYLGPIV